MISWQRHSYPVAAEDSPRVSYIGNYIFVFGQEKGQAGGSGSVTYFLRNS